MYLVHGDCKGIVRCTLSGWAGCVYRIPRALLAEAAGNPELMKSGVYCLLSGKGSAPQVYVGQGDKRQNGTGVLTRVSRHDKPEKAYWDTALVYVAQNSALSRTEICYLEHHLYQFAKAAGRYALQNDMTPPDGTPGPGVVCNMNYFLEGARTVTEALGYDVFDVDSSPADAAEPALPPVEAAAVDATSGMVPGASYTLSRTVAGRWTVEARGRALADGKFLVLRGSLLAPTQASKPCLSRVLLDLRVQYCQPDEVCELVEDVEFNSLSTAANFVIGNNVNGKAYWRCLV